MSSKSGGSANQRAISRLLRDIDRFSVAGGRPLRWYQLECSRAILRSVRRREGKIFTVMFARQMGKNETSAQLEAYLLARYAATGGSMVKAAPSFKPQIVTSILRLKERLDAIELTRGRWTPAFGYMVRLGRSSIAFFSADPQANVVGATASLLLEIDEAQDIDPDKYDRDFRPMASSTNATTVLYGTAWSEDSILERQRRINLEHQARTGERLHFEYDWRVLAALAPPYDAFVRAEIARLGEDHPSIQTQYLLRCLADAARLFSLQQLAALHGSHERERGPQPEAVYVAGVDVAGEDEQAEDAQARLLSPRRDSTVVTIARVERDSSGSPAVRVVEHVWWTGRDQVWQYERLMDLWQRWSFARVCIDASGIGAGLADFLAGRRPERVEKFVFSAPSKSRLAFNMLAMINTSRLSIYKGRDGALSPLAPASLHIALPCPSRDRGDQGGPFAAPSVSSLEPELAEFWREARACRYWLRANETIGWGVPEREGHDDFVVSLALTVRAAEALAPPPASALIRALPDGETHGW